MKKFSLLISLLCSVLFCYAEGSESLQNVSGSIYGTGTSHSFTGDNGMTWNTVGAIESSTGGYRTLTTLATVSGNGITGQLNATQVEQGLGEISFYVKGMKSGTGYGNRTFRVTAGDVTDDVVVNIPSMTNSYKVTAIIKRRNVSSFTITSLPSVSDETATFGLYNFTWTSYDGKTDKPTLQVNDTDIEYGIENGDTVYYSASTIDVHIASTSQGATFYYTTDGSLPTTSSASGEVVSLPAGGNYTVRAIAWIAALGESDETQIQVKTGRGRVVLNPAESTTFWSENSNLYTYSSSSYETKSDAPCYRITGSGMVVTPVVVCPRHLSLYATSATKVLTVAYQAGTMEIEGSDTIWAGEAWTTLQTMSVANKQFTSGVMKRFDIVVPDSIKDKFVKFKMTSSGNSVYLDDPNYISADIAQAATPILSIGSGEVANGQTVNIIAESGAQIYYSLNGGNIVAYTSPITITGPTMLLAYAEEEGKARSWSTKATYTVANVQPTLGTPLFNLASGEVNWGAQVTITADDFATLHYTVNGGEEQTAAGSVVLTITENTSISAYATCNGYTTSDTASANYTVVYPLLDEPTFSLSNGSVEYGTQVTIEATEGATIIYTINGGPNQLAKNKTTITIEEDVTIEAYAQREGYTNSAHVLRHYQVTYPKLAAPTFSVAAGAVPQGTEVTIRGNAGDTLYYTTDGESWMRTLGMATVGISQACTLSAYLCRIGYENSDTVSVSYTLSAIQIEAPYFSISGGTYEKGTTFSLSAVEGATIHYTINEEPEQTAITQVVLSLTENMEISAYATMDGYVQSETIQAAFYVKATPTDMAETTGASPARRKQLINGQIVIQAEDGSLWTIIGQRL